MSSYSSSRFGAHLHFGLFLAYVSNISHCVFILFKWYPPSHYIWLLLAWSIYQISFNSLFYYLWKRAIVIQIYFTHWFKSWVFSLKCILLQTVHLFTNVTDCPPYFCENKMCSGANLKYWPSVFSIVSSCECNAINL